MMIPDESTVPVKPYLDKSFSKENAVPIHIPVTCGIFVDKDDPLTRGDYNKSKRCKEVLHAIKLFADSSLGQFDPMDKNLPIVRSVVQDNSFHPSPGDGKFSRYLLKLTVTVFVINHDEDKDKLDRVKVGVRSALKLALGEGWI